MRAAGRAGKGQQRRIQRERRGTWQVHPRFLGKLEPGQEGTLTRSPGSGWEGQHEESKMSGRARRVPGAGAVI